MIANHLEGIINAIVLGVTNPAAESVNGMACSFRNHERFGRAIYFHLGGLDLLPNSHTKA